MLELFTILMTACDEMAVERLYNRLTDKRKEFPQGKIALDWTRNGDFHTLFCFSDNHAIPPEICTAMRNACAEYLSDYVSEQREMPLLRRLIETEYGYKQPIELDKISYYCRQYDAGDRDKVSPGKRKDVLTAAFSRYLAESRLLHVEGFLRFRVPEYQEELRDMAEYAIDEYMLEQQYQEFISLLKYFVYFQETRIPAAHIIHKGEHDLALLNEHMKPIEPRMEPNIADRAEEDDLQSEDLLVSTLISVSPGTVYIHTRNPEQAVIRTIRQIFEERVQLCTYCPSCEKWLGKAGVPVSTRT